MTHPPPPAPAMRYSPLGTTGMLLSHVAYGAAAIGSVWHPTDRAESIAAVRAALAAGVNYIDTAPWYGQGLSESVLGDALADVPRDSYFIGTKVGRYDKNVLKMFDFSKERVESSVRESLARLKLEYVDIIQVLTCDV
jgi:L-galactose dehydrogenase